MNTRIPAFFKGSEVTGSTPSFINDVLPARDYLVTIAIDDDEILFYLQSEAWTGTLYCNVILRSQMPGGRQST